jgi:frataxin
MLRLHRSAAAGYILRRRYTLDTATYHRLADHTLDHIHDCVDAALEAHPAAYTHDTTLSMGVLTIKLGGSLGSFVVNKQPPNLQIWLSSPVSGPKRFEYDEGRGEWVYRGEGSLTGLLSRELSDLLQQPVSISVPKLKL